MKLNYFLNKTAFLRHLTSETYVLFEGFKSLNWWSLLLPQIQIGIVQMLERLEIVQTKSIPALKAFLEFFLGLLHVLFIFDQVIVEFEVIAFFSLWLYNWFLLLHFFDLLPSFVDSYLFETFFLDG